MPSLNLQNLLWSTRGKEWGFRFIHQPASHPCQWDLIYQDIFGRDDRIPQRWHGLAILPGGTDFKYVASRFFDPEAIWKDTAGREIPHEMLLDVGSIPTENIVNRAWEYTVMNQVRGFYRDAYSMDSTEVQTFEAPTDDMTLPLTLSSVDVIRLDIELEAQRVAEKTPCNSQPRASVPLNEEVWRILNTDVTEIFGRKKHRY